MATALGPQAAYELWAETYPAEAHNPLMEAEQRVVSRILAYVPAKRALDVGTGSGRYVPILATSARSVVGIDLSMAMLMRGSHRRSVQGDACCLPFPDATFDLVNASLMVGDVADLVAWTRETTRVMSPGGHLVFSDFHPSWSEFGWLRTFRTADGALHSAAFVPHAIQDHLTALATAGCRVLAIREPRLRVRGIDTPVVAIFHAVKNGGARR